MNITKEIKKTLENCQISEGFCNVFLHSTTAGLMINEDDKLLIQDFKRFFSQFKEEGLYSHQDNAFSHLRANLLLHSLTIPIANRSLLLGKYQNILFWEFDRVPRKRSLVITINGE